MVRKARITKTENDQTQDIEALSKVEVTTDESPVIETVPVVEVEAAPVGEVESPVIEVEASPIIVETTAQSDDSDMNCPDLKALAHKLAELEDKFVKLELELSTLVNKKGRKKGKKVKCKCKGKKVPLVKCKCASKKLLRQNDDLAKKGV